MTNPALVAITISSRAPASGINWPISRSESPAPYAAAVSIKVPPASRNISIRPLACSADVSRPQVMVPRPTRDTRSPLVPTGRISMGRPYGACRGFEGVVPFRSI